MNRRTGASILGPVLLSGILVACASSAPVGDNAANDPAVTLGTVPTDAPNAVDETAPPGDPATSDTTSGETTSGETTSGSTTTSTSLVPSNAADLPTAAPDDLSNPPPPTTPNGPLPVPAVQLIEFGRFDTPVDVTTRPLDQRMFVVEQGGRIRAVDDLSDEVVLDITDLTSVSGEQGFLGAAYSPHEDLVYVHYTDRDGDTAIDEYAIDPVTAVFDPASRRQVLAVDQPYGNHNGGQLAFGPDGYLYIGLGDGGSANDPQRNALALSSRLGKILRIDPRAAGSEPFTIPPDNPFVDAPGADPTIWSLGLRNPWKFSFDASTGDLWIADVGQGDFEEVDLAPAIEGLAAGRGISFGWSAFEGDARFNEDESPDGHIPPVITYPHDDGDCSVSGGAVYRGASIPDLVGWYVYGDFCSGHIWGYDPTSGREAPVVVELAELGNLVAIAVGADNELYAVSNSGTVARFAAV